MQKRQLKDNLSLFAIIHVNGFIELLFQINVESRLFPHY